MKKIIIIFSMFWMWEWDKSLEASKDNFEVENDPKSSFIVNAQNNVKKEFIPNFFTELPKNVFLSIISYLDYRAIGSLSDTSLGIKKVMSRYMKDQKLNLILFFYECEKNLPKKEDYTENVLNFIQKMENLLRTKPNIYKDPLTSLFCSYCDEENFKYHEYVRHDILRPLFMKLIYTKEKETWAEKFIKIYSIPLHIHKGALFKSPTAVFMIQFFLDHGVSINCPLDKLLINHYADYPYKYKGLTNCSVADIFKFLLKNGAQKNKQLKKEILNYCEDIIFLENIEQGYFEKYAHQYFSMYALLREKGVIFTIKENNRDLLERLENYRLSKK